MATGPYFDARRGTWSIQWKDGAKWRRKVVVKAAKGWKPGDPPPKKVPLAATLALADYARKELASGTRGTDWETTVAAFLAEYQHQRTLDGRRPATLRVLGFAVHDFEAWCASRGASLLCQVSPKICQGFINDGKEKGRGYQYLKQQRGLLSAAWRRAVKLGTLTANPWTATELPGKWTPEKRYGWTPDEYTMLLAAAPAWLTDVLVLGCHTGLRIGALMGLKWEHIRWHDSEGDDYGDVVVPPALDKVGTGYEVPIHRNAHDVLFRRKAVAVDDGGFILAGPEGKPLRHAATSANAIVKACKKAGLKPPRSPNHAMRRTFGRWAVLGYLTGEKIDVYTVSKWMGHHSIEMTQKYLDLDRQTSRESMRVKRTPDQS